MEQNNTNITNTASPGVQNKFTVLAKTYRFEIALAVFFIVHILFFSLGGIITPERMGIRGVDPVCYFSQLRSLVFDQDLDFENEYRALDSFDALLTYPLTPLGRRPNGFSLGPALSVAPFYLFTHGILKIFGYAPLDGFSPPYQVSCFVGIAVYAFLGLILAFRWLQLFYPSRIALIAVFFTWFSSSAVYYAFPITFMPHAISLFFVVLFLYYAEKTKAQNKPVRWIMLGLMTACMSLVRWQNILFSLYLTPEILGLMKKSGFRNPEFRKNIALFILSGFAGFFPQFIAWKRLYGSFFTIPQGGGFLLWFRPSVISILFSSFNGLFSWTPVTLVGVIGLLIRMKNKKAGKIPLVLLILFCLQLYMNSIVRDWHGSWGFGMRRFVNCIPVFMVGIGALLMFLKSKVRLFIPVLALSVFLIWNYLFLVQYYLHLVAWNRTLTFHEMVTDKFHIFVSIERRGFVNTAYSSANKGYLDDAQKALGLAEEIDPNHADIYFAGGQIAASRGNREKAMEYYKKALVIAPNDKDVLRAMKALKTQSGISTKIPGEFQ